MGYVNAKSLAGKGSFNGGLKLKIDNMKTLIFRIRNLSLLVTIAAIVPLCSCTRMSKHIRDKTAGMNGSFEITKSGLPVNWLVYTPETVPTGDFDIIIDTTEYKDGKQSLKFLVRDCSPGGGWWSPGFCNEFEANPGEIFRISFFIKNHESQFLVKVGGVSVTKGEYDTIVNSDETIDDWQLFEYYYTIPENMKAIRIELNILKPGTLWIDDIKIEKVGS
jgi:hypothetical protein